MAIGENGRVGRILISNDDGIDAMGIEVLEAIAREIADEVWVVAPEGNCSGFGRSITLKREIRATRVGDNRYTCDGTPTDCVIYAVNHLMAETPPDLVLSGINLGMNISDDITCSGTIGAAWEAAVYRIPAIALSQKYDATKPMGTPEVFDASRQHGVSIIQSLMQRGWPDHVIMNVNFPSLPADGISGIKVVSVGSHKVSDEIIMGSGENTYRIGKQRQKSKLDPDSDIGALFDGYITVTPLSIDMTDYHLLRDLGGMDT
jgi:5'-nucleotidase